VRRFLRRTWTVTNQNVNQYSAFRELLSKVNKDFWICNQIFLHCALNAYWKQVYITIKKSLDEIHFTLCYFIRWGSNSLASDIKYTARPSNGRPINGIIAQLYGWTYLFAAFEFDGEFGKRLASKTWCGESVVFMVGRSAGSYFRWIHYVGKPAPGCGTYVRFGSERTNILFIIN